MCFQEIPDEIKKKKKVSSSCEVINSNIFQFQLYHVDSRTSKIYLTLSSDSSCNQNLYNSTTGYESLILSKTTTQKKMPPYVIKNLQSWVEFFILVFFLAQQ